MDSIIELLDASVHNILYLRDVYPENCFLRKKVFNIPVQRCNAPELCTYIENVLTSMKAWLKTQQDLKFVIVIINKLPNEQEQVLERYVFDLHLVNDEWNSMATPVAKSGYEGMLLKLSTMTSMLQPINKNCNNRTFRILLYTNERNAEDVTWQETLVNQYDIDKTKCDIVQLKRVEMGAQSSVSLCVEQALQR